MEREGGGEGGEVERGQLGREGERREGPICMA